MSRIHFCEIPPSRYALSWIACKEKDFSQNLGFLCIYLHTHIWSQSRESGSAKKVNVYIKIPRTFYFCFLVKLLKIKSLMPFQSKSQLSHLPQKHQIASLFWKLRSFSTKSPSFFPLLLTLSPPGDRSIPVFLSTVSRLKPSLWQQPSEFFLSKWLIKKENNKKKVYENLWDQFSLFKIIQSCPSKGIILDSSPQAVCISSFLLNWNLYRYMV